MKLSASRTATILALLLLATCCATGCLTSVVRPEPLVIQDPLTGETKTVRYPLVVITHDPNSFWDWHQIKDNILGLMELEGVRIFDVCADTLLIPGEEARPLENGIEAFKNAYSRLPRIAPFNTIGEFFSALGLEKTCFNRGPLFFPRIVYMTDWVQNTLGDADHIAGTIVLDRDTLFPSSITTPLGHGVNWMQKRSLGNIYVFILWTLDELADEAIDVGEAAWGKAVWCIVAPWN